MDLEQIFPGIYLTLCEDKWTTDKLRTHGFTHIIRIDKHIQTNRSTSTDRSASSSDHKAHQSLLDRDHPHLDGFETLDLNFSQTSYLTTVLPNCYKGVRFIDNALKKGGRVLIDVNQMYEYEPILQVQRTLNLYGTSCSRELRSSMHKRKISEDTPPSGYDDKWNSLSFDSSDTIME